MTARETSAEYYIRKRQERVGACPVRLTDLLHISRGTDKCRSYVLLEYAWDITISWLVFGEATLVTGDRRDGRWTLEARMADNACDFEHDTAYALRLPLIGVEFEWADHHQFQFHGFVDPQASEKFNVPGPGYDPTKHPDAAVCSGIYDEKKKLYCKWNDKKPHVIVPEGFYVPPFDAELYKHVAGKRVELRLGLSANKEAE